MIEPINQEILYAYASTIIQKPIPVAKIDKDKKLSAFLQLSQQKMNYLTSIFELLS